MARALWHEGLVTVYRLLFILRLETTDDPARSFSFASISLWRNTYSPNTALAPLARAVLDHGADTGHLLEEGVRGLCRMFTHGLQCTELNVKPMGGVLFAPEATPILSTLHWPEPAIARLLDRLLWTTPRRGSTARERVHYGPLDVEDLGRIYEALLELEPGISAEPMCRLRPAKLEVVVPAVQGERYKPQRSEIGDQRSETPLKSEIANLKSPEGRVEADPLKSEIRNSSRPLRPPPPQSHRQSHGQRPLPRRKLRFLGEALYDAARRCDELAAAAEKLAESYRKSGHHDQAAEQEARAAEHRQRVIDSPDPDDELLRYLPSRSAEGQASGFSEKKAKAICKRMVAVHCLYGVDKNPLAVELAKLALWVECHAEGLPLTFLDHRLVVGDLLTGPFFEHLLRYPGKQEPLDDLFTQGLTAKLTAALADALQHIRALEATVGVTVADIEAKQAAKTRLDRALAPFKILAASWSGGVMLGPEGCDDTGYAALARLIAETGNLPDDWLSAIGNRPSLALLRMIAKGLGLPANADFASLKSEISNSPSTVIPALPFDLAFPEVFYLDANPANRVGFDADLGNPPWDAIQFKSKEFFAVFDFEILNASSGREREAIERRLLADDTCSRLFEEHSGAFEQTKRANDALYSYQFTTRSPVCRSNGPLRTSPARDDDSVSGPNCRW